MSSETERITNEVLNRHPWDKLEGHPDKAIFEGMSDGQRTTDVSLAKNRRYVGSGEAILEPPQ